MDGVSVAFTSYAIAAVISMGTAAIMAIAVKLINVRNNSKDKKD